MRYCRFVWLMAILFCMASAEVKLGIDQLFQERYLSVLAGKRLAVVTNLSSRDGSGMASIDRLLQEPDLDIRFILTPEHGLSSKHDQVIEGQARYRGKPVVSLYGRSKIIPVERLKEIDAVIYDLQDTGLRFYTYISSLAMLMQQAAKHSKLIVVLDRPNPQGGQWVQGAGVDKALQGNFIAYYPIPMLYGLTIGELAQFYQHYYVPKTALQVVPMQGWTRAMHYEDTGLVWVSPSPALPHIKQVTAYAILGPLESLKLSVARGIRNDRAFLDYGSPIISFMEAKSLVTRLNQLQLPGLRFDVASWTPTRRLFKGQLCHGFSLDITDVHLVKPYESFLSVAKVLYQQFGDKLGWSNMHKWLGERRVVDAIKQQLPNKRILAMLQPTLLDFKRKQESVLLYT